MSVDPSRQESRADGPGHGAGLRHRPAACGHTHGRGGGEVSGLRIDQDAEIRACMQLCFAGSHNKRQAFACAGSSPRACCR
ncbi:hypothetical protein H8959_012148 [Pygathrix nigripes]